MKLLYKPTHSNMFHSGHSLRYFWQSADLPEAATGGPFGRGHGGHVSCFEAAKEIRVMNGNRTSWSRDYHCKPNSIANQCKLIPQLFAEQEESRRRHGIQQFPDRSAMQLPSQVISMITHLFLYHKAAKLIFRRLDQSMSNFHNAASFTTRGTSLLAWLLQPFRWHPVAPVPLYYSVFIEKRLGKAQGPHQNIGSCSDAKT